MVCSFCLWESAYKRSLATNGKMQYYEQKTKPYPLKCFDIQYPVINNSVSCSDVVKQNKYYYYYFVFRSSPSA